MTMDDSRPMEQTRGGDVVAYERFLCDVRSIQPFQTERGALGDDPPLDAGEWDVLDLLADILTVDLIRAGMTPGDRVFTQDKSLTIAERWSRVESYLDQIRDTSSFATIDHLLRDVYGLAEWNGDELTRISQRIAALSDPGVVRAALDRIGARAAVPHVAFHEVAMYRDSGLPAVPAVSALCPHSLSDVRQLEAQSRHPISSLRDLLDIVEGYFDDYRRYGVRSIKFINPHRRPLQFRQVRRNEAEECFSRLLSLREEDEPCGFLRRTPLQMRALEMRDLDDFLVHAMIQLAGRNGMTVIVQTGSQGWGVGETSSVSPATLNDVLFQYPDVTFVLLQLGVPFFDEAIVLCRYFPNCYLNLTWMHVADGARTQDALRRYLEALPAEKIIGFGGDHDIAASRSAHRSRALENTAEVLWERIESGALTVDEALALLRLWFADNPRRIHGVPQSAILSRAS